MNYFLVLNLFLTCFYTGKILSVRFLLTHPVYSVLAWTKRTCCWLAVLLLCTKFLLFLTSSLMTSHVLGLVAARNWRWGMELHLQHVCVCVCVCVWIMQSWALGVCGITVQFKKLLSDQFYYKNNVFPKRIWNTKSQVESLNIKCKKMAFFIFHYI